MIRLRVCAGWSEPLLVAHTTLFKISCRGSNIFADLHSSTITSVLFAPDDDKVITTSMDRTTQFYDLKTKKSTIKLG